MYPYILTDDESRKTVTTFDDRTDHPYRVVWNINVRSLSYFNGYFAVIWLRTSKYTLYKRL